MAIIKLSDKALIAVQKRSSIGGGKENREKQLEADKIRAQEIAAAKAAKEPEPAKAKPGPKPKKTE